MSGGRTYADRLVVHMMLRRGHMISCRKDTHCKGGRTYDVRAKDVKCQGDVHVMSGWVYI